MKGSSQRRLCAGSRSYKVKVQAYLERVACWRPEGRFRPGFDAVEGCLGRFDFSGIDHCRKITGIECDSAVTERVKLAIAFEHRQQRTSQL